MGTWWPAIILLQVGAVIDTVGCYSGFLLLCQTDLALCTVTKSQFTITNDPRDLIGCGSVGGLGNPSTTFTRSTMMMRITLLVDSSDFYALRSPVAVYA